MCVLATVAMVQSILPKGERRPIDCLRMLKSWQREVWPVL